MSSLINALSRPSITNKPPTPEDIRRNDLYTIVWFLFALFLGFGISNNALTASTPVHVHDDLPTIDVPAGWIRGKLDGVDLYARNPHSPSSFNAELTVSVRNLKEGETLPRARSGSGLQRGQELSRYRELGADTATVFGQPALLVTYAFVADPTRAAGAVGPPVVAEGQDLLYVTDGKLVVVSVAADATEWDAAMNDFRISL